MGEDNCLRSKRNIQTKPMIQVRFLGGVLGIEKLTNFIQFKFETLLLIVNVSILIYV